ncbi:MAG: protein arginine kinase [Victivallaceae bacterium]|nr:protein arginine kinase [Victivallaceae bacterium]
MSNPLIAELPAQPVGWLADSGPDEDIAISSRIRLARNLAGRPFPVHATDEELSAVADRVITAAAGITEKPWWRIDICELDGTDRMILFERRLVSRELFKRPAGAHLLMEPDEQTGIMVNEEDHIRLQSLLPGLQLAEAYEKIDRVDCVLAEKLDIAYDDKLGFLTSCPTNLGTAMRASVMLHLPALVLENRIAGAVQGIGQLGLTVRGIFGEGSDNRGNLFQISNQSTLGESEPEIIDRLGRVIAKLIDHEKNARRRLLDSRMNFLLDKIGRAYGCLRNAYILSAGEALNALSLLRLGVDLKMFDHVSIHTVNNLFVRINPAHLSKLGPPATDPGNIDAARATLVRTMLREK